MLPERSISHQHAADCSILNTCDSWMITARAYIIAIVNKASVKPAFYRLHHHLPQSFSPAITRTMLAASLPANSQNNLFASARLFPDNSNSFLHYSCSEHGIKVH